MARNITFKRGEIEFELDTASGQITTDLLCRMFSVSASYVVSRTRPSKMRVRGSNSNSCVNTLPSVTIFVKLNNV